MKTHHLPKQPSVSVVIPSYNEGLWLKKTVDQVLASNYSMLEVIIVDDVSSDGSSHFLQEDAYTSQNVKLIVNASGKNWGVSKARHAGAERATGDLLIFLDAHMVMDPNWIQQIVEAFNQNPLMALAGPMVYSTDHPDHKDNPYLATYVYTNCDVSMWAPRWMRGIQFKHPRAVPFLNAAGLCIPRMIYEELGGFPDWIEGWGPEDRCLSLLAYQYGYYCYRLPHVFIGHEYKENLAQKNPELDKERKATIAINCLKSCYLLYDDEEFDRVRKQLKSRSELAESFVPDEDLRAKKRQLEMTRVRTYRDFVREFEQWLPYRYLERLHWGQEDLQNGHYEKALDAFRYAMSMKYAFAETRPEYVRNAAFLETAKTHWKMGNIDMARDMAETLLKKAPHLPHIYLLLAEIATTAEDRESAHRWGEQGCAAMSKHWQNIKKDYYGLLPLNESSLKNSLSLFVHVTQF